MAKKIGVASLILMASVFLSRLAGLFRDMIIAYAGGVGGDVDVYYVAFTIPEILNHLVASGFMSVTFIPIFSGYLVADLERDGWHIFSVILSCFGTFLLICILVSMIFTPELVGILAPGLRDPVLKTKAIRMTRIILPAQLFFFAGGMFMAVQFAKERFIFPALAPIVYNIGIIGGGIFLSPFLGMEGFSWGVLLGAFFGNFLLQYWGAKKSGMVFRLAFQFGHPDLKKYIILTLPLMLGLTMTFSTEIFLKFFGSFLPRGSIASLNYGLRIMYMLVGFFGQAIGMAVYPFLAKLATEKKLGEMGQVLNHTVRLMSLVIPFSVLFIILRHELIRILFQRGQFDAGATDLTAQVLIYLMIGAFAFAVQTIVARGFYAMQNTMLPAIFSTLSVVFSIPFYIIGMRIWGIGGVAGAISLSAILQVLMLFHIWNRYSGNTHAGDVYKAYGKMICFSIPFGAVLFGFRQLLAIGFDLSSTWGCLAVSAILGVVFLLMLGAGGSLLKIEEIKLGLERVARKIARRGEK
jgi:putative peptidoglycan lipid II flippase